MGLVKVLKKFQTIFWVSNVLELFERWAWYGFYMAMALFLVSSKDTGALGFTQVEKGLIMGTGSMLLYLLPIITGAIADKIGYRKVLFISYVLYISGFFMVRSFNSFEMVFLSFIWLCVGGAFFKPIVSAMIARTTNEETSSIGFGIFYMMINIGGFIGPFIAGIILDKGWDYVFFMSIAAIAINLLITLIFFREPIEKGNKEPLWKTIGQALKNIYITLLNWKYVIFLLIMVLYWTVFNQLFYSFPVFVGDWVDTSIIYNGIHSVLPGFAESIGTSQGTISPVTFGSMDAFFIILFQLLVSTFVMRFKPLSGIMGGALVIAGGLGMMFSMQNGWIVLLGVLVFSLGEMGSSPKFTEYIGRIAPSDQKALYMGTSFLPIAAGHQLAGWLSGAPYANAADKLLLLQKEVMSRGLDVPAISNDFSKNDYFSEAARQLGLTQPELTDFLWRAYHPDKIWMTFSGIAVASVVLLFLYDKFILVKKK